MYNLNRQLDTYLKPMISFFIGVRPMSISMGNVVRYVKGVVSKIDQTWRAQEVRTEGRWRGEARTRAHHPAWQCRRVDLPVTGNCHGHRRD